MATSKEGIQHAPNSLACFDLPLPEPRLPDSLPSPITELTQCFTGLVAFNTGDTPRRRLDLSNISTESCEAMVLTSPKHDMHSDKHVSPPLPLDSPVPRSSRMKQFRSFLPSLLCSSPKQLSHTRAQQPSLNSNKENVAVLGQQTKVVGETHLYDSHELRNPEPCALGSPISPPADCHGDSEADGFMEVLEDQEETSIAAGMSSSMAQLLSDPLMNQDVDLSSVSVCHRRARRLFRSPSMPERLNRVVLKRAPQSPTAKPPFKRHRTMPTVSEDKDIREDCEQSPAESKRQRCLLKKTLSLCEVAHQLGGDVNAELIGDFSKVYALPTVSGRHQDLKYITGETMCALLNGEFSSLVESFVVVDCRYPYEFQGGHIKGALNLPNTDEAVAHLLRQPLRPRCPEKRFVLVLHCEFSSERAPRTCRLLRREDRSMNENEYPFLHYPELYILKGGYRDFFHAYKEYCEPQSYCPMHHEDHREELLQFRSHSRASAEDRRRRQHVIRLIKL